MTSTKMTIPARHWRVFSVLMFGSALALGQTVTNAPAATSASEQDAQQKVVMSLIEALKTNNYRQALDTLYFVQVDIAGIQRDNPRVLWEGLLKTYYDRQIAEIAKPQDDPFAALLAVGTGNRPVRILREIGPLYQNQRDLRATVIETRKQPRQDPLTGRAFDATVVYVKNEYSSSAPPVVNQRRLKESIVEFDLYAGAILVAGRVAAGDVTVDSTQPSNSQGGSRPAGAAARPITVTPNGQAGYPMQFPVGHEHALNRCWGTLVVSKETLKYLQSDGPGKDAFDVSLSQVASVGPWNKSNTFIEIVLRDGRKLHFSHGVVRNKAGLGIANIMDLQPIEPVIQAIREAIAGTTSAPRVISPSATNDSGSLEDKLAALLLRLQTLPPAKSSLPELLSLQASGKADEYFEVYLLAVDRQGMATNAGIAAQRFLERKDSTNAAKFYSYALSLETDANKLFGAAEDINLGSLDKASSVVQAVY